MTRWRPRASWVLRWGGLAAVVVVLGAIALSVVWEVTLYSRRVSIGVGGGAVGMLAPGSKDFSACFVSLRADPLDIYFRPVLLRSPSGKVALRVPLWMPLLIVSAPTLLAWRRWRPAEDGVCTGCGYNLSGITTGVCPECGKAAGA
jgi:hypothetical protein